MSATEQVATQPLRLTRPPDTEPAEFGPVAAPSHHRGPPPAPGEVPVQGTLALLFLLPGGAPAVPTPAPTLRLVPARPPHSDPDDEVDEPALTPRADLPDPHRWSARLVQAAIEARHGDRPVAQLLRWTSREVYDRLTRESAPVRGSAVARGRIVRPVIRSLHVSEPADGIVEACAVVHDGVRARAVAMRLEGLNGRWLCTALDIV